MLRPAMFMRRVRCGSETPSHTGIMCVTPSPESTAAGPVHGQGWSVEGTALVAKTYAHRNHAAEASHRGTHTQKGGRRRNTHDAGH
jgi:hypothetical protein